MVVAFGRRGGRPGEGVAVGVEVGQGSVGLASVEPGTGVSGHTVAPTDETSVATGPSVARQALAMTRTNRSDR